MKSRRYADGSQLLDHTYVSTEEFDGGGYQSFSFAQFNGYVKSLDEFCNKQRDLRRISVTADEVVERATRSDLKLADILQADAICALAAAKRVGHLSWFLRIIIYAERVGKLELFARAVSEKGLAPLKVLIPVADAAELLTVVNSQPMRRLYESSYSFFADIHIGRLLNLQEISDTWGIGRRQQ